MSTGRIGAPAALDLTQRPLVAFNRRNWARRISSTRELQTARGSTSALREAEHTPCDIDSDQTHCKHAMRIQTASWTLDLGSDKLLREYNGIKKQSRTTKQRNNNKLMQDTEQGQLIISMESTGQGLEPGRPSSTALPNAPSSDAHGP